MNKRQKAKHYKQLYERTLETLLRGSRPVKVEHTSIPVQTYRVRKALPFNYPDEAIKNLPDDANGISYVIRKSIERDISDFIYKNIKINEVHGESEFPNKVYETTIRIAF